MRQAVLTIKHCVTGQMFIECVQCAANGKNDRIEFAWIFNDLSGLSRWAIVYCCGLFFYLIKWKKERSVIGKIYGRLSPNSFIVDGPLRGQSKYMFVSVGECVCVCVRVCASLYTSTWRWYDAWSKSTAAQHTQCVCVDTFVCLCV